MKHSIFIILAVLFAATASFAQTGSSLNVTGVCVGSGAPNVSGQNTTNQNQLIECSLYKDTLNNNLYAYNPTLASGNRWALIAHDAVTVTDHSTIDFTLTGQNITAQLAQQGATTGQILRWNGTSWLPANPSAPTGQNLTSTNTAISVTGGTGATLTNSSVTFLPGNVDVNTLAGPLTLDNLDASTALGGQILQFDGIQWSPVTITTSLIDPALPVYVSNAAALAALGTGKRYRLAFGSTEGSVGTVKETY